MHILSLLGKQGVAFVKTGSRLHHQKKVISQVGAFSLLAQKVILERTINMALSKMSEKSCFIFSLSLLIRSC